MKKILIISLISLLILGLFSCSSVNQTAQSSPNPVSSEANATTALNQTATPNASQTVQNASPAAKAAGLNQPNELSEIKLTITDCKASPVTGDRTKDNVAQKNGDYFALGSNNVKASDYDAVNLTIKIDNTSAKAYTFSQAGLTVKFPDGYELQTVMTGSFEKQVASNSNETVTLVYYKEKKIAQTELQISYNFQDYSSYMDDATSVISGKMKQEDFVTKYQSTKNLMNFDITLS